MRAPNARLALNAASSIAPGIAPGVAQSLARFRAGRYRNVRYEIEATLTPRRFAGTIGIALTIERPSDIVLDWQPDQALVGPSPPLIVVTNGVQRKNCRVDREHLIIPRAWTQRGENQINVSFSAPIARAGTPITRVQTSDSGETLVYSLFVPANARRVFPCFDQPDLKARFQLGLSVPRGWLALSNTRATRVDGQHFSFAPTEPLSTYLFAFAAGPFVALTPARGTARSTMRGTARSTMRGAARSTMRETARSTIYVRRSQQAALTPHRGAISQLNERSLQWLERFTATPLPTDKLDLILIPEFPYGGMEHAGAIFYSEAAMRPRDDAGRRRRAALIFHENAHQWFGNVATMRWFDDLWLKEGFANLLAARQLDALTASSGSKFLAALAASAPAAAPLTRRLPNLIYAWTVYNAVPYGRGPALLDALSKRIGRAAFQRLARGLVAQPISISSADLIGAVRQIAGAQVAHWLNTQIEGPAATVPTAMAPTAQGPQAIRPATAAPAAARRPAAAPIAVRNDTERARVKQNAYEVNEPALERLLQRAMRADHRSKASVLTQLANHPDRPDRWVDLCLPRIFAPAHAALAAPLIPMAIELLAARVATRPLFTIDRWLMSIARGATSRDARHAFAKAARQSQQQQSCAELRHKLCAIARVPALRAIARHPANVIVR